MKKITLFISALVLSTLVKAQLSVPYSNDFNTYSSEAQFQADWTYINSLPGQWIFDNSAYFGNGPSNAPVYSSSSTTNGNDWLVSPAFSLTAGTTYSLNFMYNEVINGYQDKMSVHIGTGANALDMTSTIVDLGTVSSTTFNLSTTNFTVPVTGTYYIGFYTYSDAGGGGIAIDDFSIDISSSIANQSIENIEIYPNPTTGKISINTTEGASISVYNLLGKLVMDVKNINATNTIDFSFLSNGSYILNIIHKNKVITRKITLAK